MYIILIFNGGAFVLHEITIEEFFLKKNMTMIDVRSPIEFSEGAIPHAINIPLLTDEERHIIGKIFKQEGERKARWKAMEVVTPKLPFMLAQIKQISNEGKTPLLYCWRGGMRSKAVATFAEFSGLPSYRLIDGYKGYRKYILSQIPQMIPKKAIVIHGGTGVGKTDILHKLKQKGYPILDLEKIANHRGSVFGTIGKGEPHNQKTFDSLLFEELLSLEKERFFFVEAESRRIGRAIQPDELLNRLKHGIHIQITASLPKRVERILLEYTTPYINEDWYEEKVIEALSHIEKRITNNQIKQSMYRAIANKHYDELISILLTEYYDPRYGHSTKFYEGTFYHIDGENIDEAVYHIEQFIRTIK